MGASTSAGKTNKANLNWLRGKTFFREVAQPRAVRRRSRIDESILKDKAIRLANRKLTRRLTLAIILSSFVLFVVAVYSLVS